jgi:hypothetical protein
MHRRTDPAATAHSDRPRHETSTTQEVNWNMKFDERGKFVSAMQEKHIITERDEMPTVEVCTKEQLRLLGRHREDGIAHYKAKYEGLQ